MISLQVIPEVKLSREDEVQLGERMKRLSTDPVFAELVTAAAEDCVRSWEASKAPEVREAAWQQLQGIRRLVHKLEAVVERGNLRAAELRAQRAGHSKPNPLD